MQQLIPPEISFQTFNKIRVYSGGSRIFIGGGGGGGAEDYVPACTLRARNWTHFQQGGPGSSGLGFVLMLSRAIWALFLLKHSD